MKFQTLVIVVAILLNTFIQRVSADDIRPAYLQLSEIAPDRFQVLWKVPAKGAAQRLALDVKFDTQTRTLSVPVDGYIGGAHLQRWAIERSGGLTGLPIHIDGLEKIASEVLLRIQYLDGRVSINRVTPDAPTHRVTAPPGMTETIRTYFTLGVEHILIGFDHLLFVLVLMILVPNLRKLVWTITAFTIAHSITLSLAALSVIRVPVPPVEACIALSIVFVSSEIIRSQRGNPGIAEQHPWLVAFTFGFLHGLGFAAALERVGLPQTDIPAALLFFNVGVEIGQLGFVAVLLLLVGLIKRYLSVSTIITRGVPAYAAGSLAAFWTIERTVAFWN